MNATRAATAPLIALFLTLVRIGPVGANQPPLPPAFIEPLPGAVVSASDPHFNLYPFADPDSGDLAESSDFEVWDDSLNVRVWADLGETASPSHVHIGDGVFEGPLSGESHFAENRDYRVRALYRDSSGAPNAESPWSAWVQFRTAPLVMQFPLKVDDILDDAYLLWVNEAGVPVEMPSGAIVSSLELTGGADRLLLLEGSSSFSYVKTNPPAIPLEQPVRLALRSGSLPWTQFETRLRFHDQNAGEHTIYLPGLDIPAGDSLLLWVNEFGATYYGSFADTEPHFDQLAREVAVPWIPAKAGVRVDRVVGGLFLPVHLAFLPDPGPDSLDAYFYVTELYGKVKAVTRNYTVITLLSDLLNFPPTGEFAGSGEMGVTGITYYPPENALYVTYAYRENDLFWGRVIRAWLTIDRKSAAAVDTVFQHIPIGYSHQVHMVTVGSDGNLYVNTGDGLFSQYAQIVGDLRGKILRMTRNGAIPPDNPFPGTYTYALGFRNPVGAAFRPGTGDLFICDNGASTDDRIVKVARGSNYGWCCTTSRGAIKTFTPTVAPVAVAFPPAGALPPQYDGRLFMTMSGPTYDQGPSSSRGKQIWSFALDDTGAVLQSELFLKYVGNGFGTCAGLGAGPDGLYFTDLYGEDGFNESGVTNANIYRVSPTTVAGTPAPPPPALRLRLTVSPNPARSNVTIRFELPAAGRASVRVFDVQGRITRTLGARDWPPGPAAVAWDGADDQGRRVPNGIYFVRLEGADGGVTGRVVMAR